MTDENPTGEKTPSPPADIGPPAAGVEPRTPAQRSGRASKDAKGPIVPSGDRAREGTDPVPRTGESPAAIVTSIRKVAEIAAAGRARSPGIGEVSQAVTSLDGMTRQNAALVEETAAALQSAQGQVDELRRVAASYGTGEAPAGRRPP